MQQFTLLQPCTTGRFLPLRSVSCRIPPACTARQGGKNSSRRVVVQAWTQVLDHASGKPYYWNTETNETAWEIPTPATTPATSNDPQPSTSTSTTEDPQASSMTHEELFNVLAAAYHADGSGMEFWEVARAHRKYDIFEPPFFEYLEQRQKAASSEADRDLAFKMTCRLSNPLLRQPAPFE